MVLTRGPGLFGEYDLPSSLDHDEYEDAIDGDLGGHLGGNGGG